MHEVMKPLWRIFLAKSKEFRDELTSMFVLSSCLQHNRPLALPLQMFGRQQRFFQPPQLLTIVPFVAANQAENHPANLPVQRIQPRKLVCIPSITFKKKTCCWYASVSEGCALKNFVLVVGSGCSLLKSASFQLQRLEG